MPSFASLGKFFGRTASEGAAFAAGVAVAPALSPVVREIVNEANAKYQTHPIDAGTAAAIVAEDVAQLSWGEQEATFNGVSPGRFDRLYKEALNAPGPSELREMFRRGKMTPAEFEHGLRKAKLEGLWDEFERALIDARLSPEVNAELIQRSLADAPFDLPYDRVGAGGRIPSFPRTNIDPVDEAKASGIDKDRLYALTALAGNPPGPEALYNAQFRGAIDPTDTQRGLAEGRARQEWAPAYEAVARAIPSVTNYVEARVRGWISPEQMNEGIARHGMTPDDGQLEFLIHGRPLSWHQVFIGMRRGGVYDGPTGDIDAPFLKALQESNIRPEWYSIAWAQRYTYPAAFVLRTLAQAGDISEKEAETILLYEGWEPTLAKTVSAKWAQGAAATTSSAGKKAETSLLAALHSAYVNDRETEATARAALAFLNADPADADRTIAVWNRERQIVRSALTAAQIKKAIGQPNRDKAWALERLAELGYTAADAETFLSE